MLCVRFDRGVTVHVFVLSCHGVVVMVCCMQSQADYTVCSLMHVILKFWAGMRAEILDVYFVWCLQILSPFFECPFLETRFILRNYSCMTAFGLERLDFFLSVLVSVTMCEKVRPKEKEMEKLTFPTDYR